jgi:hypothetical protein
LAVKLLHSRPCELVDPTIRTFPRRLPGRPHETLGLERAQRPVETTGIAAREPEPAQALEQVVPVPGLLAQKEQHAGPKEVPGENRLERLSVRH